MLMNQNRMSTGLLLCVFFVFGCSDTKDKNEPDAEDKEVSTPSTDENNQGNTDATATDTVDGNSSLNPNDTIVNGTDDTATAADVSEEDLIDGTDDERSEQSEDSNQEDTGDSSKAFASDDDGYRVIDPLDDTEDSDDDTSAEEEGEEDDTADTDIVSSPSKAGEICGDVICETDLDAAMELLKAGEFEAAFEAYRCGDTAEAAMGAALTKTILLAESDPVSDFMARAGYTPLVAAELLGPDSLLARHGRRWKGKGEGTIVGNDMDVSFSVTRARAYTELMYEGQEEERLSVTGHHENLETDYYISTDLHFMGTPLEGDTIELIPDCGDSVTVDQTGATAFGLNIDLEDPELGRLECGVGTMRSLPACPERTGSIVLADISALGERVTLWFSDFPVSCSSEEGGDVLAYFNGSIETYLHPATVQIDDLHPFWDDPEAFWDALPTDYTLSQAVNDMAPIANDMLIAACYAEHADNGYDGLVFKAPEELNGLRNVPIATSDAKFIAAGLVLSASGIRMAESYESQLRFKALDDMTKAEQVEEINANVPTLKDEHKFSEAKELMIRGLQLTLDGLTHGEPTGYVLPSPLTDSGRDQMETWVIAALDSINNGPVVVSKSNPPIEINLAAWFSSPPDPGQVDVDPVVLEVEADDVERIEAVEVFYQQLFDGYITDFNFELMEENDLIADPDGYMENFFMDIVYRSCYLGGC